MRKVLGTAAVVATIALSPALGAQHIPAASGDGRAPVTMQARKNFEDGVGFLHDPDGARYEPAYAAFKAAYQASPSWKILGNLGLCALKLERNSEAIEAYQRYLAQGGTEIEAAERAQIEKDLRLLQSSSATVKLSFKGAAGPGEVLDRRTKSDGAQAVNVYAVEASPQLTLVLHEGHHQITAKLGGKEGVWEVTLAPGETKEYVFDVSSAGPGAVSTSSVRMSGGSSSPLRTVGFAAVGVGGAMLVGGLVTGLIGKGKLSDLESSCPNRQCPADKTSDRDAIESLETTTNVLLIGGGVVAAAGVVLVLVGKPSAEASAAPRGSLQLVPSLGGVVARGTF